MDNFEMILNSLPEKPARSRLDPYGDLILELLTRGWTYREIARILLERCGVHISISTIHYFVRTRSRSKRKLSKSLPQKVHRKMTIPTVKIEEKGITNHEKQTAQDEDVYKRIAALKQRQASSKKPSEMFHYDPDEPLHLPEKEIKPQAGR